MQMRCPECSRRDKFQNKHNVVIGLYRRTLVNCILKNYAPAYFFNLLIILALDFDT